MRHYCSPKTMFLNLVIFISNLIRCIGLLTILIVNTSYADQKISIEYKQSETYEAINQLIRSDGLIERIVNFIDSQINLTTEILVVVGAHDGPVFDLNDSQILIPYSFVVDNIDNFVNDGYTLEQAETFTLDVLEHTLFHEFGHGLVDQLKIPFTGREEDTVDELAGLLVIASNQQAGEVILSAADSFRLYDAQINQLEESDFSAEHSLDIQRFYNLICMTYASDPENYYELILQINLNSARADRCLEDYPRQIRSWLTLLEPHLRSPRQFSKLFNH